MKLLVGTVFLLFFGACTTEIAPSGSSFAEVFTLKYNEEVSFKNSSLKLKVTNFQDSRCPADVQCIRAGELLATIVLTDGSTSQNLSVCLDGECSNQANYYHSGDVVRLSNINYALEIVSFLPQKSPKSGTIDLANYSCSLKVVTK
jgi:hypothetical protein